MLLSSPSAVWELGNSKGQVQEKNSPPEAAPLARLYERADPVIKGVLRGLAPHPTLALLLLAGGLQMLEDCGRVVCQHPPEAELGASLDLPLSVPAPQGIAAKRCGSRCSYHSYQSLQKWHPVSCRRVRSYRARFNIYHLARR